VGKEDARQDRHLPGRGLRPARDYRPCCTADGQSFHESRCARWSIGDACLLTSGVVGAFPAACLLTPGVLAAEADQRAAIAEAERKKRLEALLLKQRQHWTEALHQAALGNDPAAKKAAGIFALYTPLTPGLPRPACLPPPVEGASWSGFHWDSFAENAVLGAYHPVLGEDDPFASECFTIVQILETIPAAAGLPTISKGKMIDGLAIEMPVKNPFQAESSSKMPSLGPFVKAMLGPVSPATRQNLRTTMLQLVDCFCNCKTLALGVSTEEIFQAYGVELRDKGHVKVVVHPSNYASPLGWFNAFGNATKCAVRFPGRPPSMLCPQKSVH